MNVTSGAETDQGDRPAAQTGDQRTDAGGQDRAADDHPPARARGAVDGDFAHRRDRGNPTGPAGRDECRGDGHDGADGQAGHDRARRDDDRTGRDVDAERRQQHLQQLGHADAGGDAGERGDDQPTTVASTSTERVT